MMMQSVTDCLGGLAETLGREMGRVADAAGRSPETTMLVVALFVASLIVLALSRR